MLFKPAFSLTLFAAFYLSANGAQNFTLDESVQSLARANQEFSVNLYKQLVKPKENLVVSGFSVSTVLSILLQGTRGQSALELQSALKYDQLRSGVLEDGYRKVLGAIKGDGNFTLSTANSIWVNEKYQILSEFSGKVRDVFSAEAKSLRPAFGKDDINQYVENKTQHLIKDMLKENPSEDTVAILLNVLFFKGTWKIQFENTTFEAGFIDNDDMPPADSSSATTRMMKIQKDVFRFVESQDLKSEIVELPYNGDEATMLVLLPSQGTTLLDLEESFTADKLQRAIKEMQKTNVSIIMPTFRIDSKHDLVQPLVRLGVKEVFTDKANLSGIAPNLKVTDVLQKAVIEVTPEGSKAAAATTVTIKTRSGLRDRNVRHLRVTHPFMFVLLHKPTNNILFMGRYSQSEPFKVNK